MTAIDLVINGYSYAPGEIIWWDDQSPNQANLGFNFSTAGNHGSDKDFFSLSVGNNGLVWMQYLTPGDNGIYESYDGTGSITKLASALVSAVPEPGTYPMMLAGLGMVGLLARRRRAMVARSKP